ncbi:MAG: response regulator transcription factor [Acidobacteriaceae bacterium]|nr:response regulator transcription factor [Acidobacteriaceae bacterium]
MRLLIAEDEPEMARFIARGLREHSYAVDVVDNGEAALNEAQICDYDVVLLDVNLPKKDGFSVCRELRAANFRGSILLLTAFDDSEDVVCGLNCGADDYISKPFDFGVLLARIHALLRRVNRESPKVLSYDDLKLDTSVHTAWRAGRCIRLTAKEYALIELFMLHPNEPLGRDTIARHVWNEAFDPFSNVIDVYVNRLRNKIDRGFEHHLLHTLRNEGYILSNRDEYRVPLTCS